MRSCSCDPDDQDEFIHVSYHSQPNGSNSGDALIDIPIDDLVFGVRLVRQVRGNSIGLFVGMGDALGIRLMEHSWGLPRSVVGALIFEISSVITRRGLAGLRWCISDGRTTSHSAFPRIGGVIHHGHTIASHVTFQISA